MTPRELELLQGMCNCYSVCGANFEDTVEMVGSARDLDPDNVKKILKKIKTENGTEAKYLELRKKLPKDFEV